MTLAEFFQVGGNAMGYAWTSFSTPIPYIDGHSLYDIMMSLAFMQIAGWFAARIIKGKSAKAPNASEEPESSIERGMTSEYNSEDVNRDSFEDVLISMDYNNPFEDVTSE